MAERHPQMDEPSDGYPGTPRWVKVFGIIAVVVLLLIGFILLTGVGGPHGPQRHGAWSEPGGETRASTGLALP